MFFKYLKLESKWSQENPVQMASLFEEAFRENDQKQNKWFDATFINTRRL